MANPEQLELLKQGADAWNEWRKKNPFVYPNLFGTDLSSKNLSGINFSGINLSEANFRNTNLSGANFYDSDLHNAYLSHSNLSEANLVKANCYDAKLAEADISYANLSNIDLCNAYLPNACFTGANLVGADLRGAELTGAFLVGTILDGANLTRTDLRNANLRDASLRAATINGANLYNAELRNANFNRAYLGYTDFSRADLRGADLRGTNLHNVNFGDTNLSGADLSEAILSKTTFNGNDLRHVIGLATVIHHGPSAIGIDTIYRSDGDIPRLFLMGAGVPDNLITFMDSLTVQAIQFYSCFISYSSNDQEFAERLHADLQAGGVRVWFAPHDMPIGARLRATIDESIRVYDKLLLVLSEHSVSSQWVEQEVETALRKERRPGGGAVLFPIRLDDTVLVVDDGWPALIKDTRHVGDFTRWKEHDYYREAFGRLMRDLRAERKKA